MKPTPKAATTVVSTDSAAITGRSARGRRRGGCRAAPDGVAGCGRRLVAAPRASGGWPRRSPRGASSTPSPGIRYTSTSPKSEPSSPGRASTCSPNWATSAVLISSFERQASTSALDEGALAVGLRCLGGELERRAADRAHHLVLHVAERGAWGSRPRARPARPRAGERRGERDRSARLTTAPLSSGRHAASRMNSSSTGPRRTAATRPRRVDHEGLGVAEHAERLAQRRRGRRGASGR